VSAGVSVKIPSIKELRCVMIPTVLTMPIILADISVGDLRLFTLINRGMANPILSNHEKENRLNSLATGLLAIISAFTA